MQDGIIKGTGNSRYLKSVQNFLNLYPTYQSFVEALVDGTLPIDFNGINTAGWNQIGTALNKANLLSDATASLLGLTNSATPDDGLEALANRAIAGIKVIQGSYTGQDYAAYDEPSEVPRRTISIGATPFLVFLFRGVDTENIFWVKKENQSLAFNGASSGYNAFRFTDFGTVDGGFEIGRTDADYNSSSGSQARYGSDYGGTVYTYFAFCIAGSF